MAGSDAVEFGEGVVGEVQRSAGCVLAQILDGRRAGNEENIWRAFDSYASAIPMDVASSRAPTVLSNFPASPAMSERYETHALASDGKARGPNF